MLLGGAFTHIPVPGFSVPIVDPDSVSERRQGSAHVAGHVRKETKLVLQEVFHCNHGAAFRQCPDVPEQRELRSRIAATRNTRFRTCRCLCGIMIVHCAPCRLDCRRRCMRDDPRPERPRGILQEYAGVVHLVTKPATSTPSDMRKAIGTERSAHVELRTHVVAHAGPVRHAFHAESRAGLGQATDIPERSPTAAS